MRCQFCEQWNADEAADCAFCGNDLHGALDATHGGRPAYESSSAGRNAEIERQAAALVHSSKPDGIASDRYVRGLVDLAGGGPRSIVLTVVALALAYLVYKLTEC